MRLAYLIARAALEELPGLAFSLAGVWAGVWWLVAALTAIDPSRVPQ